MKQLLFLLLFPCLAMAQYQGNAGQKITLGEQTTADGLVFRGVANDTALITPFSDTSAYIILDTVNSKFYHYNRTTTYWALAGGGVSVSSFSAGTTGLTPTGETTGAVTLGGTLAVANGGTGATSFSPNNYLIRTNSSGIFDTSNVYEANGFVGIGTNQPQVKLHVKAGQLMVGDVVPNDYDNVSTNPGFHIGVVDVTAASRAMNLVHYGGTTPSAAALLRIRRSRGTSIGDYTKVEDNDILGAINWVYSNGTTWGFGASINAFMDGTTTAGSSFPTRLQFYTTNSGSVSQSIKMTIKNNGFVGIGTESPAAQLHTTGGVRFAGLASITDLRTDADGDLYNGSDFNLKNSIDTINFGLSDVMKLKPVSFNWNDESRNINEYKSMGFIAQDVMDVIPNAASTMGDGDMQVDYNAIVATLTKAIQEQQALIKALEQRIINLENK